jgi:E3 ubiquitin ligase
MALFLYSRSGGALIWVAMGALAGVYLFYCGFRMLQRKRLILDTPSSKIRSASMGLVEVSGLAAGPYTMIAPITGVSCFYVRTTAWQWQRKGKNNEWVKVADESLHVPFFLDDNTGRLLVDPQGAEMDIQRDFHEEFSTSLLSGGLQIPPNISTFLVRNCISMNQKLKIEEYCIKPKNSLFILGTLAQNPGLSVTATPVRRVISSEPTASLHIPGFSGAMSFSVSGATPVAALFSSVTNEPARTSFSNSPGTNPAVTDPSQQQKITDALVRAGISNPAAWTAAGVNPSLIATSVISAGGSAAAPAPAPEQFNLHPPVVLMKGAHDPAFFISWRSQRDVVRSLGWKSALMIWGGPALTLLCMYILALHFDWL